MKRTVEEYFCDVCTKKMDKDGYKRFYCKSERLDICNNCINDFVTFILINDLYVLRSKCKACRGEGCTKESDGYNSWLRGECTECLRFKTLKK